MKLPATAAWERISLRSKLTALSVALIGLLLVVSSVGTMALLKTYLQQSQDSVLTSTATVLRAEDPALVEARLATRQLALPNLPTDYYIAFLNVDGSLILGLAAGSNDSTKLPNLTSLDAASVIATRGLPFEVNLLGAYSPENEGPGWRIVAVPLTSAPGSLVVALPTDVNNGLVSQYRTIGLGFGIFLLIFSGASIWLTITRALKPLEEVERTAAAVAEGDTEKRLVNLEGKTEIARLNRSLNTMLDSIDQALKDRGKTLDQMRRFVADASHELRTPLVSVRGYAELYRMGALKEKAALDDAMGRIESEAVRMTSLVESLLTLARLDENQEITKVETELVALAREAAKDAGVASHKGNIVVTDLSGEPMATDDAVKANVDPNSMRQVLINLLANASRFSNPGDPIEIALGVEGRSIKLEVRDHGEGIPESLREKIFERFYRVDNSRNSETGGSGLGLAICKALVEHHGGRISALETSGGGATMRVELPL